MALAARSTPTLEPGQVPVVTHYCAVCRARLIITCNDADSKPGGLFDSSRIEESFIVLDDKRGVGGTQAPPGLLLPPGQGSQPAASAGPGPPRGLDESFVLLPTGPRQLAVPTPASGRPTPAGSGIPSSSPPALGPPPAGSPAAPGANQADAGGGSGLDAKLQALSQLFDLAAASLQVDQPLCLDCASQLKDEIEAQISEAEAEIGAYAEAVAAMQGESEEALPEEVFQQHMADLAAGRDEQLAAEAAARKDLAKARQELATLQAAATDLNALEEKYWHEFNGFQALLRAHVEERDGLLARIAAVNQRKQLLAATNVYNDAFKIWHDGPFATISGFRLGRTPEVPVEWDEINAAWGQAVLLLYTMAQNCGIVFTSARLIPMGSHPRVSDKRATYDLFGPVSKLWSSNYDRAMTCYLGCLKEFGDHAADLDKGLPGDRAFEGFPFPIDGDKVNGHTIKLTLNKDAKWTKALKFMLANLKKALQWMVKYEAVKQEAEAAARLAALRPEPALL